MFVAMFCNGVVYVVAGFSGDYWLGDTDRKFINWSMFSLALVLIITVLEAKSREPGCGSSLPTHFIVNVIGGWRSRSSLA